MTGCRRCGKRRGGRDDAESWGSGQLMVLLTEMKTTRVPQEERESSRPELCSATFITPCFLTDSSVPKPISQELLHFVVSVFLGYLISIQLGDLRCFASLSVVPAGEGSSDLLPN